MLKNLLANHPLLKYDEKKFNELFNKEVKRLHQNRFSFRSNLISMNKELLKFFQGITADTIKKEQNKKKIQQKRQQQQQQTIHQQFINRRQVEKRAKEKESNFEQRLSDTRAEFSKVMAGKRPEEIDFSDKIQDTPIKSNQIDLTMSQREAELAEIMKQQPKNKNVEQWLQGENKKNHTNSEINIKIDHSSNIPVNVDPIPGKPILKKKITREDSNRRVRFQVDERKEINKKEEISDLDFFQKLKLKNEMNMKSNMFNNEIKDILKTICDNQLTIIQELKTMNTRFLENLERNDKINKVENKVSGIVEEEFDAI
jgi:hypothetical protein